MDDETKSFDELLAEIEVLRSSNAKLKKRVRELDHLRQLNLAEIVNLRRQLELMEGRQ